MRRSIDELWPLVPLSPPKLFSNLRVKRRSRAYAPYSGFHVGARAFPKNNESRSGATWKTDRSVCRCVRSSALAASRVLGHVKTLAIAVAGDADGPCFPCGACRQVIFERNPDMRVVVSTWNGVEIHRIADLLPFAFDLPGRRHDDGPF